MAPTLLPVVKDTKYVSVSPPSTELEFVTVTSPGTGIRSLGKSAGRPAALPDELLPDELALLDEDAPDVAADSTLEFVEAPPAVVALVEALLLPPHAANRVAAI